MSTLTQFLGGTRSATFINTTPSNSVILPANDDPGALTANVWKTVLSLSSGGILHAAAVRHGDATSRTVGIRITIDGV